MSDLTVLHYTANKLDHARPWFAQAVREQILKSVNGRFPVITVSHEPLDFGVRNIVVGTAERGHLQIYRNILTGALAAETEFVGLAEDDVFYSESHWSTHRPPAHRFSYDFNKWGINTWVVPPIFGYRARAVINQLIAPRQLLIDALEERFTTYPDEACLRQKFGKNHLKFWGDLGRYEKHLGVTVREWEAFAAPDSSVVFSHEEAFGFLSRGTRKSVGEAATTILMNWGTADRMLKLWNNE